MRSYFHGIHGVGTQSSGFLREEQCWSQGLFLISEWEQETEMAGGGWCVCGARHRSGRRITWANLDGGGQPEPPEPPESPEPPKPPESDATLQPDNQDMEAPSWAKLHSHGKVSWKIQGDKQGDRKMKKEDRKASWPMVEKGKVGGGGPPYP